MGIKFQCVCGYLWTSRKSFGSPAKCPSCSGNKIKPAEHLGSENRIRTPGLLGIYSQGILALEKLEKLEKSQNLLRVLVTIKHRPRRKIIKDGRISRCLAYGIP